MMRPAHALVPVTRLLIVFVVAFFVVFLGLLVGAAGNAAAESGFRCGTGRLVSLGDHLVDVQKKCGEPDYIGQRVEKRKRRERVRDESGQWSVSEEREVEILFDEWIYDLGPRKFMRSILFENGRVVETGTGGYGKRRE